MWRRLGREPVRAASREARSSQGEAATCLATAERLRRRKGGRARRRIKKRTPEATSEACGSPPLAVAPTATPLLYQPMAGSATAQHTRFRRLQLQASSSSSDHLVLFPGVTVLASPPIHGQKGLVVLHWRRRRQERAFRRRRIEGEDGGGLQSRRGLPHQAVREDDPRAGGSRRRQGSSMFDVLLPDQVHFRLLCHAFLGWIASWVFFDWILSVVATKTYYALVLWIRACRIAYCRA